MAPGFALAFLTAPLVVCGDTEGLHPHSRTLAGLELGEDPDGCAPSQSRPLSAGTWYYNSQDPKCGPTHWMEMALACGGPAQSPINIDLHLAQRDPTLGPFIFQGYNSAPPGPWTLENDGHTGQYPATRTRPQTGAGTHPGVGTTPPHTHRDQNLHSQHRKVHTCW